MPNASKMSRREQLSLARREKGRMLRVSEHTDPLPVWLCTRSSGVLHGVAPASTGQA